MVARFLSFTILSIPLLRVSVAQGQSVEPTPAIRDTARIDQLERQIEFVLEENQRLSKEVRGLRDQLGLSRSVVPAGNHASAPPVEIADDSVEPVPTPAPSALDMSHEPSEMPNSDSERVFDDFGVTYDKGFAILPKNLEETPYSLKITSQNMFRYTGFLRDEEFWIDSAGSRNPISNANSFQIPRGRLIFSGNVYDPNLSYLLNIDYNSVTSNPIGFRAYELNYRFGSGLALHIGQGKVPGSREWLESAFAPLEGPDRTMATTFFRPSLSQGIWITGEPIDQFHYYAMMANGFNTLNQTPNQLNNRFAWSASAWWEPWGDFGRGYADVDWHEEPVVRLGVSYTYGRGRGSQSDTNFVENSSIRLSDGTLITQLGAIAPGVTLQTYDISLAAIDLAWKHRGWSLSTEWYAQHLVSLEGNGPLPVDSIQAYGGFLQGGYFCIPQTVELYLRGSLVTGDYGSGTESAGGLNWFPMPGNGNLRFTFDTAWLDSSPAGQNRTGFVAGQTGLLIRTQIAVVY